MLGTHFEHCFVAWVHVFFLYYTGNGYTKVKFHVEGNISNYTADQIKTIKETVAAIVGCHNEEIYLNGFCNSTSFFVVLLIKERYVNGIFNIKQQDKEKLVNLNVNYIIVDSNHVYLKYSKGNFICRLNLKMQERFSDHFISGVSPSCRPYDCTLVLRIQPEYQ